MPPWQPQQHLARGHGFPAMPPPALTCLETGFSWLSPEYRLSPNEVETYARIITAAEGDPPEMTSSHLHAAELQLWIRHAETQRLRAQVRRRGAAPP